MNQIVDRDHERHAHEWNDVVRRVEEIDLHLTPDLEQFAHGVFRRVDDDVLNSVRQDNSTWSESDVLDSDHRAEQPANVRADAEVIDLPAIDPDSHALAASPSNSVISFALRSQRYCFARSMPRA